MPEPKPDRRDDRRIPARTEVQIKTPAGSASGHTRDLSSRGVFLYTHSEITEGAQFELMLVLPAEITGGRRQWACCIASVVRVEPVSSGTFGVAAKLERVDILPEIEG